MPYDAPGVPYSRSSRPAHADDQTVPYRRTFVGRDAELQQLQSAYDRSIATLFGAPWKELAVTLTFPAHYAG